MAKYPYPRIFIVRFILPTGIDEVNESNLQVFPNPANTFINIKAPIRKFDIYLLDASRRLIKTERDIFNETTIDITGLAKGNYFVCIKGEGKVYSRQFVKM